MTKPSLLPRTSPSQGEMETEVQVPAYFYAGMRTEMPEVEIYND